MAARSGKAKANPKVKNHTHKRSRERKDRLGLETD